MAMQAYHCTTPRFASCRFCLGCCLRPSRGGGASAGADADAGGWGRRARSRLFFVHSLLLQRDDALAGEFFF